jgi:hypothetical protein
MMAVSVDAANGFKFKPAVKLFETSLRRSNQPPSYDVAPDGRFIMIRPDESRDEPITVILNWAELLRTGH